MVQNSAFANTFRRNASMFVKEIAQVPVLMQRMPCARSRATRGYWLDCGRELPVIS
jgi:hypothetical protein